MIISSNRTPPMFNISSNFEGVKEEDKKKSEEARTTQIVTSAWGKGSLADKLTTGNVPAEKKERNVALQVDKARAVRFPQDSIPNRFESDKEKVKLTNKGAQTGGKENSQQAIGVTKAVKPTLTKGNQVEKLTAENVSAQKKEESVPFYAKLETPDDILNELYASVSKDLKTSKHVEKKKEDETTDVKIDRTHEIRFPGDSITNKIQDNPDAPSVSAKKLMSLLKISGWKKDSFIDRVFMPDGILTTLKIDKIREIRFSQDSIADHTQSRVNDLSISLKQLVINLKTSGWKKDCFIDLVLMPDNTLTTLDNRRLEAAKQAAFELTQKPKGKTEFTIRARIRHHSEKDEEKLNLITNLYLNKYIEKTRLPLAPDIEKQTLGQAVIIRMHTGEKFIDQSLRIYGFSTIRVRHQYKG